MTCQVVKLAEQVFLPALVVKRVKVHAERRQIVLLFMCLPLVAAAV